MWHVTRDTQHMTARGWQTFSKKFSCYLLGVKVEISIANIKKKNYSFFVTQTIITQKLGNIAL